uniref:CARD domain-containing protein n=1 Tax=Bursaphelenchus xylophilus TaxID=6326 RepID=A0A1I7RYQ7_BURXY
MRRSIKKIYSSSPTQADHNSPVRPLEEDQIRTVLRELRTRNVNLDMDLARLERMIRSNDPLVQELVDQIRIHSKMSPRLQRRVEKCRKIVEPLLRDKVGARQKLLFGAVDLAQNFPELYSSEDGSAIAVVGPRNLKKK